MSTSRPLVAWTRRLPTSPATGSTPSRRQSASPTAASENRPPSGGVSLARATLIRARSAPYQGFARAPFTGLRVVATSSDGSPESSDRSTRAPVEARPAHPPSASAQPVEPSARNATRRERTVPWYIFCRAITLPSQSHRRRKRRHLRKPSASQATPPSQAIGVASDATFASHRRRKRRPAFPAGLPAT